MGTCVRGSVKEKWYFGRAHVRERKKAAQKDGWTAFARRYPFQVEVTIWMYSS